MRTKNPEAAATSDPNTTRPPQNQVRETATPSSCWNETSLLATSSASSDNSKPSSNNNSNMGVTATTSPVGGMESSNSAGDDDIKYVVVPEEGVVAEKVAKPESALKSFLAGGVGGICVVLSGHPLDLIKVRMQTAGAAGANQSVVGMFANTFREQGIRGLYRGVTAPLFAVSPIFALSFWGYDIGQRIVRRASSTTTGDLTIGQKCIAGGISALPTTVLMAPSERIKCLLQTSSPGQYKGMIDCAKDVYSTGGIRSLYRGTALTLMRDVPGSIAWFGTYEVVKLGMMRLQGLEGSGQLSPIAVLTAGGLAGVANWTVCIPPDVLKSRFQTAPEGTYRGVVDVYRQLMAKEGPSALFHGLRPAMIRAFPANACCFLGMECARKALAFMD